MSRNRTTAADRAFTTVITLLVLLFCLIVLYPLIWIVSASFSDPFSFMTGKVILWPVNPTLRMYRMVFQYPMIWKSYLNTILYTTTGTLISVWLSSFAAYPLSRSDFWGKGFFTLAFMITMFFSGGMIPTFLLVKSLNMLDTIWAVVLPGSVSVYNVIVMRTFFKSTIPGELQESAALDGANDIIFFFKIVLPLSKAIMAVMVLFYGVGYWNNWFSSFLYMSSRERYPVQLLLREIVIQGQTKLIGGGGGDDELIGEGVKYATMVVATVPIMCLYPFLQRYFTKGVMIGSVKG